MTLSQVLRSVLLRVNVGWVMASWPCAAVPVPFSRRTLTAEDRLFSGNVTFSQRRYDEPRGADVNTWRRSEPSRRFLAFPWMTGGLLRCAALRWNGLVILRTRFTRGFFSGRGPCSRVLLLSRLWPLPGRRRWHVALWGLKSNSICFFNMPSVENRTKLTRITNMAAKIIGLRAPNLSELNNKAIARIATTIRQDITYPLNHNFTLLPSGCRYRSLRCRRALLSKSLIPAAVATLSNRPSR